MRVKLSDTLNINYIFNARITVAETSLINLTDLTHNQETFWTFDDG